MRLHLFNRVAAHEQMEHAKHVFAVSEFDGIWVPAPLSLHVTRSDRVTGVLLSVHNPLQLTKVVLW